MLNFERDSQTHENTNVEPDIVTTDAHHHHSTQYNIPRITIHDSDQNHTTEYNSGSATETEMSSSSHHHRSSGSVSKKHSKSRSKKDDWSDITDPEERRRVQNRIAQRKFRDKAKEAKERQERDATNLAHAHASYHVPSPTEMSTYATSPNLSGLPWGSISLLHVVSKGHAKESESRHGSQSYSHSDPRSQQSQDGRSPFEATEQSFGEEMEMGEEDGVFDEGGWDDAQREGYYDYAPQGNGEGEGGVMEVALADSF